MDGKTYYFSNGIKDDDLKKLAVKAKEIVPQIDHVVKLFKINKEKYGHSPRKVFSFIQQNNESIFLPSSSKESNPTNAKSYEGLSNGCNPDTSNMTWKYFPLDDAEIKENHPETLDFSTPIGHQTPVRQPEVETILHTTIDEAGTNDKQIVELIINTTIGEAGTKDEQFASQVGSKGSHEASASADMAMMSTNITTAEKEFGSPAKVVGSKNASSLKSPRSIQISKIKESLMKAEELRRGGNQEASASADMAMMSTNITTAEKEFGSPVKVVGSNNASSLKSPRSIEISKIKESLMKAEEELRSPAKVFGSFDASYQEFIPFPEVTIRNASLNMVEKESRSQTKEINNIKLEDQEFSRSDEIITMASGLTADDKEFRKHVRNDQITGDSAANKDFTHREKNSGKSENIDSSNNFVNFDVALCKKLVTGLMNSETFDIQDNQQAGNSATNKDSPNPEDEASKSKNSVSSKIHFISHAEGVEAVLTANEIPGPVKRNKAFSIPTFDIQECSSSPEKGTIAGNSPENTQIAVNSVACAKLNLSPTETIEGIPREDGKRKSLSPRRRNATLFKSVPRVQNQNSPEDTTETVSRISGAQLNKSPIETIKGIARDDRKRKSLSPTRRSKTPFNTVPKVIKLECEEELGGEVVDLEHGASPRISRSKSADYRSDTTKNSVKNPSDGKSKTDTSPIAPERYSRPSERMSSIDFSRNISGRHSPIGDDDVSAEKNRTGNSSIEAFATVDRSCEIENCAAGIEASPTLLKETITKFNALLTLNYWIAKNSFVSFQKFQRSINFINSYVHKVLHFILTLDILGKCSTEEFKEIVLDANAMSRKLINMLQSWEKDVDMNIYAWHKCFKRSEQLKARYEPLLTKKGEPAVTFEIVQIYEYEMKAIWKKMDDIILQGVSMRALFSSLALDVERFTKMLFMCCILVGILQTR